MEFKLDIEKVLADTSKKAIIEAMDGVRLFDLQHQITDGLKTKLDEIDFAKEIVKNVSTVVQDNKDDIVQSCIDAMKDSILKASASIGEQLVIQMLIGVFLGPPGSFDEEHKTARAKAEKAVLGEPCPSSPT